MAKIYWYQAAVIKTVESNAKRNLVKALIVAETEAKKLCPVRSGRLKSSITHKVKGMKGQIGSRVGYAAPQEFGTYKMRAHPYLRPAIINKAKEIEKIIGEKLL